MQSSPRVDLRPEYFTGRDFVCDSNGQFSGTTLSFVAEDDATFSSNCEIIMTTGSIYVGGSTADGSITADFNSNTNLSNGSIYVNGTVNFDSNVDVGGGDGIYIRDDAYFNSNTDFASNGRVYVGRDAFWNSNAIVSNSSVYVGRNASFDSNSKLDSTSLFTRGNVMLNNNFRLLGTDAVYGNWLNSFNPTGRTITDSGIGAMGVISGDGESRANRGTQSFDTNTAKKFVGSGATGTQMNFPFNTADYTQPLTDAAASANESKLTADDINALREIAQEQEAETTRDHYRTVSNGTHHISSNLWPIASSSTYGYATVVFYRFSSDSDSNKVMWDMNTGCNNTDRRGILVIENCNFETSSNNSGFNGWVVVPNGTFTANNNTCMHSYIYAQDGVTANSNTDIFDIPMAVAQQDLNALRKITFLSWRELYK